MIGQLDEAGQNLIRALKNVKLSSWVPRQEIFGSMRGALALILPSEIEGFGLPALEAYSCGTPVAYVKNTAVEEILGPDSPGGFRLDDDSFAVAIDEVLVLDSSEIIAKRDQLRATFLMGRLCRTRTLRCYESAAAPPDGDAGLDRFSQTDRQCRLRPFARKLLRSGLG